MRMILSDSLIALYVTSELRPLELRKRHVPLKSPPDASVQTHSTCYESLRRESKRIGWSRGTRIGQMYARRYVITDLLRP